MKRIGFLLAMVMAVVLAMSFAASVVMAFPPLPDDLNIVQPDPTLPKELAAFSGKWESTSGKVEYAAIVEKIDEKVATLYLWRSDWKNEWERRDVKVLKEHGKYKLLFFGRFEKNELSLRSNGKYMDLSLVNFTIIFTRAIN